MNKIQIYKVIYILLLISFLKAEDVKPVVKIGYDFGLGDLLTYYKEDTGAISSISGGDGLKIEVGLSVPIIRNFEFQSLIGYKQANSNKDGDEKFTNIQITTLLITRGKRWKIGVGGAYYIKPKLITQNLITEFKNEIAGVVRFEYLISDVVSMGVEGTFLDYRELKENSNNKVTNANSLGLFVIFALPSS